MSPVKSPEKLTVRDTRKKDKIVVEIDEAEGLPPGWTKEVRIRKSGSTKKVDRYYTDPITGYIFLSLRAAQRYLKTGELGRLAIKPKNNEYVDMDKNDEKIHMKERDEKGEFKEQMSESLRRKRPLDMTRSDFGKTSESELLHDANADIENNPNDNQQKTIIPLVNQESNKIQEHNKEIEMGPTTLLTSESSVVNPTVNFSMNDLWTDPCIEFAVKTLTGVIPFGDLNKFENFTPPLIEDPRIGFPVKTLTGAKPVGENECFATRPASSRNLRAPHDFRLPDKQQNTTFGNGGLQKSGKSDVVKCIFQ